MTYAHKTQRHPLRRGGGEPSLSSIIGGLLAAVMVKLSLIMLGVVAVVAAAVLVLVRGLGGPRRAARTCAERAHASARRSGARHIGPGCLVYPVRTSPERRTARP